MSRNAGRAIAASCTLGVIVGAGVLVYTAFVGDRAVAQVIPDVGKFRSGSELGEERAGFSGRAKVLVFSNAGSAEWTSVANCLQSEAVVAEIDFFTGVLVDEVAEPEVEHYLRENGQRVVIRGLQGQVLGLLPVGYTCDELTALLRSVREVSTTAPEPSPIYVGLVERPLEVVDDLVANGRTADANRYVDLLEEFEGSASPAVQTAKGRLGR